MEKQTYNKAQIEFLNALSGLENQNDIDDLLRTMNVFLAERAKKTDNKTNTSTQQ